MVIGVQFLDHLTVCLDSLQGEDHNLIIHCCQSCEEVLNARALFGSKSFLELNRPKFRTYNFGGLINSRYRISRAAHHRWRQRYIFWCMEADQGPGEGAHQIQYWMRTILILLISCIPDRKILLPKKQKRTSAMLCFTGRIVPYLFLICAFLVSLGVDYFERGYFFLICIKILFSYRCYPTPTWKQTQPKLPPRRQ